jgi:hypothetical protein
MGTCPAADRNSCWRLWYSIGMESSYREGSLEGQHRVDLVGRQRGRERLGDGERIVALVSVVRRRERHMASRRGTPGFERTSNGFSLVLEVELYVMPLARFFGIIIRYMYMCATLTKLGNLSEHLTCSQTFHVSLRGGELPL